ncbi:DUF1330 domain-containing protein [Mesorhizobium escarrei]|uniref:DUF1330 domain-containing protein n=1 Tax=Mesorhizobium escarrei TaxID=666018 RepID=A0ABM9EG77_9HYPH|nr:DUF1330 domain-containing protein [Mesorhizobium escarrei]CAH2408370.1 hypothetical protein MES5069_680075 [Mesorhizobium escarrei]
MTSPDARAKRRLERSFPYPAAPIVHDDRMKGYWLIIGTKISNDDAQSEYAKLWKPIAEKYQARINPLKVPPLLKEARDARRVVIVEFPSYDLAQACYDDLDYPDVAPLVLYEEFLGFGIVA